MNLERLATWLLLLTTVIWGATFFTMQLGLEAMGKVVPDEARGHSPLLFLLLRFVLATGVFAALQWRTAARMNRALWRDTFLTSLSYSGVILLQMYALQATTPTLVAFLTNMTIVFTPMLGWLLFRERLSRLMLVSVAMAFAGIVLLTGWQEGGFGWAEFLALLSAVAGAFAIHLTNLYTRRHPPEPFTLALFCWLILTPAVVLACTPSGRSLLSPELLVRVASSRAVLWTVAFNGLLASALLLWVVNRFQREVAPTRAAIIYLLEPVFAALFAAYFVGEAMTANKIAGGVLIIGGNLVCELFKPRTAA